MLKMLGEQASPTQQARKVPKILHDADEAQVTAVPTKALPACPLLIQQLADIYLDTIHKCRS